MKAKFFIPLLLLCFIACDKDDDQANPAIPSSGLIEGTWQAKTIKGDDGNLYSLNQDVPSYTLWTPCRVYNSKDNFETYTYQFKKDSTLITIIKRTNYNRGWQFHDYPNSCELTFNNWSSQTFNDTSQYTYEKLSNTELVIKDTISGGVFDTLSYFSLTNVLKMDQTLFDYREVEFVRTSW